MATLTKSLGRSAGNGYIMLDLLYEHPIIAVKDVQRLTDTTYAAANNLIARMVECGIVQKFAGSPRNHYCGYQHYIELFYDDTDQEAKRQHTATVPYS